MTAARLIEDTNRPPPTVRQLIRACAKHVRPVQLILVPYGYSTLLFNRFRFATVAELTSQRALQRGRFRNLASGFPLSGNASPATADNLTSNLTILVRFS